METKNRVVARNTKNNTTSIDEDGYRNHYMPVLRFSDIFNKFTFHLTCQYSEFKKMKLYVYDSGANIAIVISKNGEVLKIPYIRLTDGSILQKYLSQEI